MNVQDIVIRVQRQFGDESGVQVTQDDVIRWINDAQNEATNQQTFLHKTQFEFPSVVGQQQYSLPDDLADIDVLKYKPAGLTSSFNLRGVPSKFLNEYVDNWEGTDYNDDPLYYTRGLNDLTVRVFPVPVSSTGIFEVQYGRYCLDVTGLTDDVDLPAYYHPYVIEFCLMKAYELDEEWEAADRKAAYVQSTLDALANREETISKEVYPSIIPSAGDFY